MGRTTRRRGPQQSGVYVPPPRPYAVLQGTLCHCEAYEMRSTDEEAMQKRTPNRSLWLAPPGTWHSKISAPTRTSRTVQYVAMQPWYKGQGQPSMGNAAAGREELSLHDGPGCIQVILMGAHPVHELGTHTERKVATSRADMNRGGGGICSFYPGAPMRTTASTG